MYNVSMRLMQWVNRVPNPVSAQHFQLVDHALDHAQSALPEGGIARVQTERLQQFRMMLGSAGREHREIALGEAFVTLLVDRVERVHQAIAERIRIHVERRMDEVTDVGPERLVTRLEVDRRAEALALHLEPEFANPIRREFAVLALGVDLAL